MKKVLALFMAIVLVCGTLTVAASAENSADLRIAVASDLHYNQPRTEIAGPDSGTIDDEIYWYANRRAAMDDESGFIIDAFLEKCAESDYDYVLISGDMADSGRTIRAEHEDVAAKFAAFEEKTGKQIFVIDGNHDLGAGENDFKMADFKEVYADFGYDQALTVDPDSCSYTANLGDKYRLIALDSCDFSKSTEDGMSVAKLNFVKREVKNAKNDGRYPIVMMHHNLIDHMPMQRIINRNFIVRFHYTTAELFADWGVRIVLSGHEHCSDAAVYTSAPGNKIYDFATTALSMYPLAFREMSFTDETITYNDVTIDKIDTDKLQSVVSGYSDRQIALMNENLNDYAKGFLKAGVQYRLWLSLTMEKMGISEDDFYYDAVKTLVGRLTETLEMPLYGENSVQSIAKAYNIDVPDSSYKTPWDLATDLVAMHYEGEEAFGIDSTEVTLLLRVVNLILHDDLANFNDKILLKGANDLLKNLGTEGIAADLTKLGCKAFGSVTAGEFLLLTIASPFLYEFAFDTDGVNDNRGTIEGYGSNVNLQNIAEKAAAFFNTLLSYLLNFFRILVLRF